MKSVSITSTKCIKRSVLSIQDKQSIIPRLEKGEKGTTLCNEYGVSEQQTLDIRGFEE